MTDGEKIKALQNELANLKSEFAGLSLLVGKLTRGSDARRESVQSAIDDLHKSVKLIFAKVKTKAEKRIVENQMLEGLRLCAQKKKMDLDALLQSIKTDGPQFKGTKTEKVALHDDRSKYTGVYARGGPTNVDVKVGVVTDLSQLTNRKEANVRGVNKDMLK